MTEHWHLYMDETGSFEGKTGRRLAIAGLLVPDDKKNELAAEYEALKIKHGFQGRTFLHSTDITKNKNGGKLVAEAAERALDADSRMIVFSMTHFQDIHLNMGDDILSEAFAANRYILMAQELLEYLLFLNPVFMGRDITFSLHPNSRIHYIRNADEKDIARYKEMGYQLRTPKNNPADRIMYLWNETALNIFLQRLKLEFTPFQKVIGRRDFQQIEMPVARDSTDPFVDWADHLCHYWLTTLRKNNKIKEKVPIRLEYGREHKRFVELLRLFISGDLKQFIVDALENHKLLSDKYYSQSLSLLFEKIVKDFRIKDESLLKELTGEVDAHLRSSSGEWRFVVALISWMLDMVQELKSGPEKNRMLIRLYEHYFNVHNHRGEYGLAIQAINSIEALWSLEQGSITLDELLERVAFKNRQAVTAANVFQFETANRLVSEDLALLESLRDTACKKTGRDVVIKEIGKIKGTMGQNMAFLAPRQSELFEGAESMFLAARDQFSRPTDRARQDLYLFHLYMDWGKIQEAENRLNIALQQDDWRRFQESPSRETAKHTQFILYAWIKFAFHHRKDWFEVALDKYTIENLFNLYGDPAFEHPFELTCGYLGRMAFAKSLDRRADAYFEHALAIPQTGDQEQQETLHALRLQTLTWLALSIVEKDARKACTLMKRVTGMLENLGRRSNLAPMLSLDGKKAVGGWFAEAWNALSSIDWEKGFSEDACKKLLDCYTFNYC